MTTSKVYIETFWQIHRMIEEAGLQPGDRLPSERELADRLRVGRSSVREALRALELLGLIETRRGEGTFMKPFGDHQLIQLLGSFILQGNREKRDLIETKMFIERMCLQLACERLTDEKLEHIARAEHTYDLFFQRVVEATDNYLLLRIWLVLNDFFEHVYTLTLPSEFYEQMWTALQKRSCEEATAIYEQYVMQKMSKAN
ncbi:MULTISPECIES: FadR/GntR family transcriptional regulator [Anoxybacillus]|uniref:DNA-binding FadR family transcriptional regulator n=1 Tax=Anoxybacillus mongoliensis TaxID=452565 RepID=A0A7W8JDN9_9BACL|nr:GntR family transcriptional regulator [Anoxybacillus mongoliensis]MBB5355182.1 DNA-binding FadR family transcriptional regulator [Anoxybacillus mongoliensis]MCX8001593.1 GntR family transcriptional regulator [Anoxybacillus mongoliensis]